MKSVDLEFDHVPAEYSENTCEACGESLPLDWVQAFVIDEKGKAHGYHVGCAPIRKEESRDERKTKRRTAS